MAARKMVRVVHHNLNYYRLRSDPGIVADLERRGARVLQATGGEAAGYAMGSTQGRRNPQGRWRIGIYTYLFDAILDNARNNTLLRALGAGS